MLTRSRTDDAVPSNDLRSQRSVTYGIHTAVIQPHTHGLMVLGTSSGKHDCRNRACGPRPQPVAISSPCSTPCAACLATRPLTRCTHRAARARPRPALRARRLSTRLSPNEVLHLTHRQQRDVPQKHNDWPLGSGDTEWREPANWRMIIRAETSATPRRRHIRRTRRSVQRGHSLWQWPQKRKHSRHCQAIEQALASLNRKQLHVCLLTRNHEY